MGKPKREKKTKAPLSASATGIIKPKAKRKARGGLRRGQAYNLLKALGGRFAADTALGLNFGTFTFPTAQRLGFLDRALDSDTKTLAKDSLFGGRYRSTWGEQDELFSTASTRFFVQGLLNSLPRDQIADDVWQRWTTMVDLISALRIPTAYSGFSTATLVMQHPTAVGEGYFSPLASTESHGGYDSERVKYIGRAIQVAQTASLGAVDQLRAAMRAAIEFSLNYFTAPVTASNVKPFSTKSMVASGDESLQDQLVSRERIKDIYVQLGGSLRDLPQTSPQPTTETPEQSWDRPWQQSLTITTDEPFPVAPPSPRRSRKAKTSVPDVVPTAVPVGTSGTSPSPVNPFALPSTSPSPSGGPLSPSLSTPFAGPVFSLTPLPGFSAFSFASSPSLSPFSGVSLFASPVVALASTLASDVVQGMTQAVQSVVDATPSAPPIEEWDSPARNPADPVEDRLFDDLDFGDGMWDRLGESEPLGDSSWFMEGFGPMPSAPPMDEEIESDEDWLNEMMNDESYLSSDMFSSLDMPETLSTQELLDQLPSVPSNAFGMQDGMELTDGMFPAVPTGVPGASMGELGADAAGGEELLAVLLV